MSEHEVWNELGNLYVLANSHEQAIRAYQKAIELSPLAVEPCNNLAETLMQMGRFAEAAALYRKSADLLNDSQQRATALHRLGDAHLQLKEYAPAMEAYRQADELVTEGQDTSEPDEPSTLSIATGETLLSESGDENPASSSGMELLPFIEELTPWWFEGQTPPEDSPEEEFDLWPITEPSVVDPGGNIIFTEPLKWDLAIAHQNAPIVEQEVSGHVQSGSMDDPLTGLFEVMSAFTHETANSAGMLETQSATTVVLEAEDSTAPVMVITDAPDVLTGSPEFATETITSTEAVQYEIPVELPVVELSAEKRAGLQADIEKLKRTLDINPRNPVAWDTLGGNYKALGQYEDALHAYRKAVSLDSSKAYYFHHLGLVFAAVGNNEEAIAAFERVIEIDPNHSLAHATLGGYYRKNGKEELAQAHIVKARSLLANDENEYNRACMEAICGNTDQALELLEVALKNKQTYVNWARKDPDLDFIRNDSRFHALLAEYATKPAQ